MHNYITGIMMAYDDHRPSSYGGGYWGYMLSLLLLLIAHNITFLNLFLKLFTIQL